MAKKNCILCAHFSRVNYKPLCVKDAASPVNIAEARKDGGSCGPDATNFTEKGAETSTTKTTTKSSK